MRSILPACALLVLGCSSESPDSPGTTATGGLPGTGGTASTGGTTPTGGTNTGGARPMTPAGGTGGQASGGAFATGGISTGGVVATGGVPATGGAATTGGVAATGGSLATGGAEATGGATSDDSSVAKALNGLRIDAPCEGTPPTTDGSTCNHTVLTNNTFKSAKDAAVAGTSGTTYDVKLRIRGVVEPTSVEGGTRADTSTFSYKNAMWREMPYTVGGTVKTPDYQAWRLAVESPQQDYFLNDYQNTAHNVFELDYEITIPIAANSKITLDVFDSNERQIVNYEKYELEGIPGSTNFGQFVQVDVVSVTRR